MYITLADIDQDYKPTKKKFINRSGLKFGRLIARKFAGARKLSSGRYIHYYHCECECGRWSIVATSNLTCGITRSCGCLKQDEFIKRKARSRMYRWLREKNSRKILEEVLSE